MDKDKKTPEKTPEQMADELSEKLLDCFNKGVGIRGFGYLMLINWMVSFAQHTSEKLQTKWIISEEVLG